MINNDESPLRKYWTTATERILCAAVLLLVLLAGVGTAGAEEVNLMQDEHFGISTYEQDTESSSGLVVLVGLIVVTIIVILLKKEAIIKLFKER